MSERKTEQFVEAQLTALGYPDDSWGEQASGISGDLRNALKNASKSGTGRGKPEYVIGSDDYPDYVIAIECKPEIKDHAEAEKEALHYAEHLSRIRNVIAVAVSGDKNASKISVFLQPRGAKAHKVLATKKILQWKDFVRLAEFDPDMQKLRWSALMKFSADMHEFIRDNMGLAENEKPLLVSGTLLALQDRHFRKSYSTMGRNIGADWGRAIERELKRTTLPPQKVTSVLTPYQGILGKAGIHIPLLQFVQDMHFYVHPYMDALQDFDIIGQFYGEFLKYTGGDKKGLGIVLTPHHVTKLFAALSGANKNSRVLDICAGTGGFLISAMKQMIADAQGDSITERNIKHEGLIGVEDADHMYALAVSNMVLRGDGKANMYHDDCFKKKEILLGHKCDIGLLNPPYSQTKYHELDFVEYMLDCLVKGGVGIAIVPTSCALEKTEQKHRLLSKHTLLASMTMPTQLFYPVGTTPCVMVFKAHHPHSGKTWFADWTDDGYVLAKHIGRIDHYGKADATLAKWVSDYKNKTVRPGYSVLHEVTANDEWCVEAYVQTDYAGFTDYALTRKKKENEAFSIMVKAPRQTPQISMAGWADFKLTNLFSLSLGVGIRKLDRTEGNTPYVGASNSNNGVTDWVSAPPSHEGNRITVTRNGESGIAFYQPVPFFANESITVLTPRGFELTPNIALFICSIIEQEKFKYSYGRKWGKARMLDTVLRLPAKNGTPDWEWMENYMKGLK